MSNNTYNGWTNYATWRVNLEIFDGLSLEDLGYFGDDALELYDIIKEYAEECIYQSGSGNSSLAVDYALSFLSDVDWYGIAKHKLEGE